MSETFNPEIFREYDIRGIADRDLTDAVIELLGRAFAEHELPASMSLTSASAPRRPCTTRCSISNPAPVS
jgi:hypothetical protein